MAMNTLFSLLDPCFYGPNLPILTTFISTLLTILLLGYLKSRVFPLLGKNLPPGTFGLPFIGESISFLTAQKHDKVNDWLADRIKKFGPVFRTSLMGSNVVVVTGQAGNRFVFAGAVNGIGSNQSKPAKKILGEHSIFEISGNRHKLVRGAIMSFLKPESLQRLVGQIDSVVKEQLFQELNGKDSVQGVTLMKTITFKQKEVVKAREANGGILGWGELQMMKYTWRVAQELMRLCSPAFGNFKTTTRDTSFNGLDIPKGWQDMAKIAKAQEDHKELIWWDEK